MELIDKEIKIKDFDNMKIISNKEINFFIQNNLTQYRIYIWLRNSFSK